MTLAEALPLIVAYLTTASVIGGVNYGYVSATGSRKWKNPGDDGFWSAALGVFWPIGLFLTLAWIVSGITKWTVTEVKEPKKNRVRV